MTSAQVGLQIATAIFVRYEMKNVKCGTIFQNYLAIGDG